MKFNNIFYHKRNIIVIDILTEQIDFIIKNQKQFKCINIILNNIDNESYNNILKLIDNTSNKIILTSFSVLTHKFAENIYKNNKEKVYINRENKLVLAKCKTKEIIFSDTFKGVEMVEYKNNKINNKIIFNRKPLIKFKNKPEYDIVEVNEKIKRAKNNSNLEITLNEFDKTISIYCKMHNHFHKIPINSNYIIGCPFCGFVIPDLVIDSAIQNIKTLIENECEYIDDFLKDFNKELCIELGKQILERINEIYKYKFLN